MARLVKLEREKKDGLNNIKFTLFKKIVLKWVRVPKEKLISIKIWYNKKKVQNLLTVC